MATEVILAPCPYLHFHDNDGRPLSNGFLWTYIAGTTTPLVTYMDATAQIPNTNPIQLDFRGECSVWLDVTRVYKFVLEDRNGAVIWTQDNIFGGAGQSQIASAVKTVDTTANNTGVAVLDPELSVTLSTVGQYVLEIMLIFDASPGGQGVADTAGISFTFNASFGDVRGLIPVLLSGSVQNLVVLNVTTLENTFSFFPIAIANYGNIILIKGSILASSAGVLSLQWAQEVAQAYPTTLRAGSYMLLTQVASQVTGQPSANTVIHTFNTATTNGIEVIPFGVNTLTLEMWGAGGGGGGSVAGNVGGGGGSGEYVRAVFSVTGMSGQQIGFAIGQGGMMGRNTDPADPGSTGNLTSLQQVSASAFQAPSITVNAGQGGGAGSSGGAGTPGAGGAANNPLSSTIVANVSGGSGVGQTGGTPPTGINGTGGRGGNGATGQAGGQGQPQSGSDGVLVFTYTV